MPAHADGCVSTDRRIFGTYLHGIFDGDIFRHSFLRASRAALRMPAPMGLLSWSGQRRQQLDLLADAFGEALDLNAIFGMVGLPSPPNRVERMHPRSVLSNLQQRMSWTVASAIRRECLTQ